MQASSQTIDPASSGSSPLAAETSFFSPLTSILSKSTYSTPYLRELGLASYLTLQGIVYPLERLKVLQQTEQIPEVLNEKGKYSIKDNIKAYLAELKATRTYQSIYRGLGVKLTKVLTKETSALGIHQIIKSTVFPSEFDRSIDPLKATVTSFLAAAVSGGISEIIAYPFEFAQTRILCEKTRLKRRNYTNAKDALYASGAPIGNHPFTGALYSLYGAMIYRGIQLGLYEFCVNNGSLDMSPIIQLPLCVGITVIAQKASYHVDTLRRHIMLYGTPAQIESSGDSAISVKELKDSFKSRPKADYYKGWKIQAMKSVTSGMFLFLFKAYQDTLGKPIDLISTYSM